MDKEMKVLSYDYRMDTVRMIMSGGGGHIGGDMSEAEILLTLYNRMNVSPAKRDDPDRDRDPRPPESGPL